MPPDLFEIAENIWALSLPLLLPVFKFLKVWGLFILPFLLFKPFKFFWLFWRIELWLSTVYKPIVFEIKIPKENLKPIRAMEDVLTSIHQVCYQPPDWWEKWIEGQVQTSVCFEIISIGGEIRFLIRFWGSYRDAVESSIYAQFPEAEISQIEDYVKKVPQDIPNKDWDFFGSDYKMLKDDHYPIKTYIQFETEREALEEKRIDPIASLLESLAKIKPGEQMWIQFLAEPVSEGPANAWVKKGEVLRDKLAKRPEKSEIKPMAQEMAEILISGPSEAKKEEEDYFIPPEMKLTPGEKEVITALEKKLTKPIFSVTARFIYMGKIDVWFKPNFRLAFSYFNQYATSHLNNLQPNGKTLTKIHKHWFLPWNLLRDRRSYLRRRRLFRQYRERLSPFFPKPGGTFMLNVEELASLVHFPSWVISPVPGVSRVESKKGAPPGLPTE